MTMVEVFKTNVLRENESKQLTAKLLTHFPDCKINFDLQDCDKILRIEGINFLPEKVTRLVKENGFMCSILE
jgi:hypothetical protein